MTRRTTVSHQLVEFAADVLAEGKVYFPQEANAPDPNRPHQM